VSKGNLLAGEYQVGSIAQARCGVPALIGIHLGTDRGMPAARMF